MVAIYGFPNPDWIVASTDPAKTSCKDMVGQPVGVDAVGGARSIALRTMLLGGCPGVKIEDVQQVRAQLQRRARPWSPDSSLSACCISTTSP